MIKLLNNIKQKKHFGNSGVLFYLFLLTFHTCYVILVHNKYTQIVGFSSDDVNTVNKMNIIKDSIERFLENDSVTNG